MGVFILHTDVVARYLLQAATGEANGYYIHYYFGYYA